MKCSDIMSRNVELLYAGNSVDRAATRMTEERVGFLGGDSDDKVVGVVTDRYLVNPGDGQRARRPADGGARHHVVAAAHLLR